MGRYLKYLLAGMSAVDVAGMTGISKSTIYKYASGVYKPGLSRLKDFENAYARFSFNEMRTAGVPQRVARNLRYSSPEMIDSQVLKVRQLAEDSAERHGRDIDDILQGYAQSEYTLEEIWDRY